MKKTKAYFRLGICLLFVMSLNGGVFADSEKQSLPAQQILNKDQSAQTETALAERNKTKLLGLVKDIQNQERKVLVLADLYNQELSGLRQKQSFFCDIYKLDLEKFRKGLYAYDEKSGKFIERKDLKEGSKNKNSILG